MRGVAEALPFLVVGVFVVIGAIQLLARSDVYGQIGRGGLSVDEDAPRPAAPATSARPRSARCSRPGTLVARARAGPSSTSSPS